MNAIFQEYKRQVDECKDCKIVFVDDIETDYEIEPIEFSVKEKGEYNRAKEKAELRKMSEEYVDR